MDDDMLNGHWHLRREVSVGHLISSVMLFIMLIAGYVDIQVKLKDFSKHIGSPSHENTEMRLDIVESEIARMQVLDEALTTRIDSMLQQTLNSQAEIIRRLERIEDRMNNSTASKEQVF